VINLVEYFDFNHSVVRVYRDTFGKIWYLKEDILRLLRLDNVGILPNIEEKNELKLSINNYLKSIPNPLDIPQNYSPVNKIFIDKEGLEILLIASALSKDLKVSLINWINSEIIKDDKFKIMILDKDKENSLESKSFEISDKGISEISIKLSKEEYFSKYFYEQLYFRLRHKVQNLKANKDTKDILKEGVKLVLDCIKENNLELVTSSKIKLEKVSGEDYETYEFLKRLKLMIESFLKDIKGMA